MYAIIETGGKQYRVQEGDIINIEKLEAAEEETVELDRVLLVEKDGNVTVGGPLVEDAKVVAKVVENGKGDKVYAMRYKPKKNVRKKRGHRQPFTRIAVESIQA